MLGTLALAALAFLPAQIQSQELARICQRYVNKNPAKEAARHIIKMMKDGTAAE